MLIKLLLIFIAGFAFAQWGLPLIDGIISLLLQLCEAGKGPLIVQVQKSTNTVKELKKKAEKDEDEDSSIAPIGFAIPTEEDDAEDEEV